MSTPLQLEEYFFPHVRVSADPGVSESTVECRDFETKVDVIKTEDGEHNYQVSLSITSSPESAEKRATYLVELVAIGFFEVSPDWEDPIKLLKVTGASILYASAREFLITITSRGPWGAIMLPTTSFLTKYNKRNEEAPPTEKPEPTAEAEDLKPPKKTRKVKK